MATKKKQATQPAKADLPWHVRGTVWSPIDWDHREVDESRCRASVHAPEGRPEPGGSYYFWQCSFKAKYTEHGLGWCSRHRPSAVLERQRKAGDRDTVRHRIKQLEEQVGQAYLNKRRWGDGKVKAAKAVEAAYQKLVQARSRLMKLEQQQEKARKKR
jgi:hypothetical protein